MFASYSRKHTPTHEVQVRPSGENAVQCFPRGQACTQLEMFTKRSRTRELSFVNKASEFCRTAASSGRNGSPECTPEARWSKWSSPRPRRSCRREQRRQTRFDLRWRKDRPQACSPAHFNTARHAETLTHLGKVWPIKVPHTKRGNGFNIMIGVDNITIFLNKHY